MGNIENNRTIQREQLLQQRVERPSPETSKFFCVLMLPWVLHFNLRTVNTTWGTRPQKASPLFQAFFRMSLFSFFDLRDKLKLSVTKFGCYLNFLM